MVKGREKQTHPLTLISSPITSALEAQTTTSSVPNVKARPNSMSIDDSTVDYMSILGMEDRRKRFSEEVEDGDLKQSVLLQKVYRQIQRQVHCSEQEKV